LDFVTGPMNTLQDLTHAEWELVLLLRTRHPDDGLVIGITGEPGQWCVRTEVPGIGRAIVGTGENFSQAWDTAEPASSRQPHRVRR